jgi:plasmid maintenance system antidote protein VapI
MRVTRVALAHMIDGRHGVSGEMIVRVMRATGLTLDELLSAPKLVRRAS